MRSYEPKASADATKLYWTTGMSESYEVKTATGWYRITATPDGPESYEVVPIPDPEPDTYRAQEREICVFNGMIYGVEKVDVPTFEVLDE